MNNFIPFSADNYINLFVSVHFHFQCRLPDVEECMQLAEKAQKDGNIFESIKYYLLTAESEKALPIGIQYVKGKP